jgi:leucine dehydrogenase
MMSVEMIQKNGYETIVKATDPESGLKAIIAVHNTNRGPAVGGTRLYPYASEEEAMTDVLRLSRGMTYKSALAGVKFGGGKSVIIADPSNKSPELLKAFGKFVDSLEGKYFCAEDMNTTLADMDTIKTSTDFVLGRASGDPSPMTALGIFICQKVAAEEFIKTPMNELTVAIQGVGNVGKNLIKWLTEAGVKGGNISIADVNEAALTEMASTYGCNIVPTNEIHRVPCDIYAPCAMGGILSETTIPELKCKAVVGGANNQLATESDAALLQERGILYAPDYLVNAGGIINVYYENLEGGYDEKQALTSIHAIGDTLREIFAMAEKEGILPAEAADRVAESRFTH